MVGETPASSPTRIHPSWRVHTGRAVSTHSGRLATDDVRPAVPLRRVLGAFTTFSTLMAQIYHYLDRDQYSHALLLPLLSVVAGVAAVYAGILAGRQLA